MAKVSKEEERREKAMELAIQLHNFRSDVSRSTEKTIEDAKRIEGYLEDGN